MERSRLQWIRRSAHFRGSRFCQVSSLNWVLTSSLKWSNAEGPVPAVVSRRTFFLICIDVRPNPFFGSWSGILLIFRYTL
jgi:hypothetical protein